MKILDFSRSFFVWRVDTLKKPPTTASHKPLFTLNNARVQLDCYCELKGKGDTPAQAFALGASCKTERVGVDRDIWSDPNADFVPVLSSNYFMALKTFDRADKNVMLYPPTLGAQPERQVVNAQDAFDSCRICLSYSEGTLLDSADQIIETTLRDQPLVARTEIDGKRYTATLQYPVKTINVNERDSIYQTDTGPVLWPDLSIDGEEELIRRMELAFAAFNSPQWTEFIVRAKTQVGKGISVHHYCKSVRVNARNQVFLIKS